MNRRAVYGGKSSSGRVAAEGGSSSSDTEDERPAALLISARRRRLLQKQKQRRRAGHKSGCVARSLCLLKLVSVCGMLYALMLFSISDAHDRMKRALGRAEAGVERPHKYLTAEQLAGGGGVALDALNEGSRKRQARVAAEALVSQAEGGAAGALAKKAEAAVAKRAAVAAAAAAAAAATAAAATAAAAAATAAVAAPAKAATTAVLRVAAGDPGVNELLAAAATPAPTPDAAAVAAAAAAAAVRARAAAAAAVEAVKAAEIAKAAVEADSAARAVREERARAAQTAQDRRHALAKGATGGACGAYEITHGVQLHADHDIHMVQALSETNCCESCIEVVECDGWTYHARGFRCMLKVKGAGGFVKMRQKGSVSGVLNVKVHNEI